MINLKTIARKKSIVVIALLMLCKFSSAQDRIQNDSLKGFDEKTVRKEAQKNNIRDIDLTEYLDFKKRDFIQKKYYPETIISDRNDELQGAAGTPICDPSYVCDHLGVESGSFTNEWTGYLGASPGCCSGASTPIPVTNRIEVIGGTTNDPYGGFPQVFPGGSFSVKLGNSSVNAQAEKLTYRFNVPANPPDGHFTFSYNYAVVLQDPGHNPANQPWFEINMYDLSTTPPTQIPCSHYRVVSGAGIPGFKSFSGGVYRPWATNTISLDGYFGKCVRLEFTTFDCTLGGHFGYAYIDGSCFTEGILTTGTNCSNEPITFVNSSAGNSANETYLWSFGDNSTSTATTPVHIYSSPGTYTVTLQISHPDIDNPQVMCVRSLELDLNIDDCSVDTIDCENCIMSFAPEIDKKYILSAWVKEVNNPNVLTYTQPEVKLEFLIGSYISQTMHFIPQLGDKIIDGWQRIEREFTIPNAEKIRVVLTNNGTTGTTANDVLFDDIRIWPYDGSMKSFVYDPISMKLMAEMDEKNYATFYEYDEEGALIRVKKETERGIMTIKESRNNTVKP